MSSKIYDGPAAALDGESEALKPICATMFAPSAPKNPSSSWARGTGSNLPVRPPRPAWGE